jgi:hypothetical protein
MYLYSPYLIYPGYPRTLIRLVQHFNPILHQQLLLQRGPSRLLQPALHCLHRCSVPPSRSRRRIFSLQGHSTLPCRFRKRSCYLGFQLVPAVMFWSFCEGVLFNLK